MTCQLIPKQTLGLAAEFAVASELCRRGIYAQLTLGNRKSTDLLVDAEDGRMLCVQVKAKQKKQWPGLKGVSGVSMLLILVDYEKKELHDRPDFYILTPADWKEFVRNTLIKTGRVKSGVVTLDKNFVPTWRENYVGMGVKADEVTKYKECWEKVIESLSP